MAQFKKVLFLLLRIVISVALLVLLFKLNKIDLDALVNDIKGADRLFLALGLVIFPLVHILGLLRWQMLLKAVKINIPLKKLISSFCGGIFFT